MKKRFFVVGALIGALLLLLIMYGFAQRGGSPAEQGSPITIETGTTTGAIIEQVPIEKYAGEPITNICSDRVLKMLPSDRRGEFPEELKKLSRTLRASPYDTESWLRVGNVKHYLDCYEGARDAWEYVLYLSPESVAAAENLGSLYTTDIQNFPLAEKYYRIAIRNNSKDIAAYLGLAEVDRIQKKSDQAITVLKEGLAAVPNDFSLTVTLGQTYEERGDRTQALVHYEKALALEPQNAELKAVIEKLKAAKS